MSDFLPPDYQIPTKPYFKFLQGDNLLRILASPVMGFEYFNTDNKPVRSREALDEIPDDIKYDKGKPTAVKHFWALKVWNYKTGRVEMLELTQKGIITAIKGLSENPKWGSPLQYDICINKTGELLTTEYTVVPEPKTELTDEQARALNDTYVNLEAIYTNDDPFIRA